MSGHAFRLLSKPCFVRPKSVICVFLIGMKIFFGFSVMLELFLLECNTFFVRQILDIRYSGGFRFVTANNIRLIAIFASIADFRLLVSLDSTGVIIIWKKAGQRVGLGHDARSLTIARIHPVTMLGKLIKAMHKPFANNDIHGQSVKLRLAHSHSYAVEVV